ncbi:MAG: chromosome segregation protein SMC [Acidiferrobacteraceae bacterium]
MRLRKIKLSGFKSFVDPVTIPVSANLVGVVGPNGCGKSNIIDAVRWVMGESSAKHLRGDSMSDVIFSGSSTRKPVGRAAVELVFDNEDGQAPGPYSAQPEISIRREAGRDGESEYFLNRVRCRRRDVMDLFLGTGVGARAYAIIEQGTVTRIIESKPEDLRVLFDEAAGVSRYKERRRDSETRMRHVRENLDRVDDVRRELEGQLARLQRQSKAAVRYQELKRRERDLQAELLGMRLDETERLITSRGEVLARKEADLEQALAGQRAAEAALEKMRAEELAARESAHELDARVRAIGAEIVRLEQEITHVRGERERRLLDREVIDRDLGKIETTLANDVAAREAIEARIGEAAARRVEAESAHRTAAAGLADAERASGEWRARWTQVTAQAADAEKSAAVEAARVTDLTQQIGELSQRIERLEQEIRSIETALGDDGAKLREDVAEQDRACEALALTLQELDDESRGCRAREQQLQERVVTLRGEIQTVEARLASLEELQIAARGGRAGVSDAWLAAQDLRGRLADRMQVASGWEKAVERVLGVDLAAHVAGDLDRLASAGAAAGARAVSAFAPATERPAPDPGTLLGQVSSDADLTAPLASVHIADTVEEALARRSALAPGESIITRDGFWCGHSWVRFPLADPGLLVRGREMEDLRATARALARDLESAESSLAEEQRRHAGIEDRREAGRERLAALNRERASRHSALGQYEARLAQLMSRRGQLGTEHREARARMERFVQDLEQTRTRVAEAEGRCAVHARERDVLTASGRDIERATEEARTAERVAAARVHALAVEQERMQSEIGSITAAIERLAAQRDMLSQRRKDLDTLLAAATGEDALQQQIGQALSERVAAEAASRGAREALEEIAGRHEREERIRQQEAKRADVLRAEAEDLRLQLRELSTRKDALCEQMRALGVEVKTPAPDEGTHDSQDPSPRSIEAIEAEIAEVVLKVERLGPINLAAIGEYEEHARRKEFLDSQHADLSQALTSLEEAIRKIDRETRARFRETFEQINAGFQNFFPRLFGGGDARLELSGDDMLETGVTVMARPPGKRNTTIHLLSGGEKALTAVALIFAIFELNPAPFCLLDEVDAPLDDANVERYAQTLRSMSERTQLIYVTHNRVSMETADLLLGVTMSEPGVSKLVSVDVEQAVEMVAKARRAGA